MLNLTPTAGLAQSGFSRRAVLAGGIATAGLAACGAPASVASRKGTSQDTGGSSSTFSMQRIGNVTRGVPAAFVGGNSLLAVSARDYQVGANGVAQNTIESLADGTVTDLADPAANNIQYANYSLQIADGVQVVVSNDGIYVVTNTGTEFKPFSIGDLGSGAIVIGSHLYVSVSQLENYTPTQGYVIKYNLEDGVPTTQNRVFTSMGTNPTGLGSHVDESGRELLVVMQSGNEQSKSASIRFFDTETGAFFDAKTINLPDGDIGQLSGKLAMSADGRYAYVGTSSDKSGNGTGNFYKIDLQSGQIVARQDLGTAFHADVELDEARGVVYVTSFNNKIVSVLDADTLEILDEKTLDGYAGPMGKHPEGGVVALDTSGQAYWIE